MAEAGIGCCSHVLDTWFGGSCLTYSEILLMSLIVMICLFVICQVNHDDVLIYLVKGKKKVAILSTNLFLDSSRNFFFSFLFFLFLFFLFFLRHGYIILNILSFFRHIVV